MKILNQTQNPSGNQPIFHKKPFQPLSQNSSQFFSSSKTLLQDNTSRPHIYTIERTNSFTSLHKGNLFNPKSPLQKASQFNKSASYLFQPRAVKHPHYIHSQPRNSHIFSLIQSFRSISLLRKPSSSELL